MMLSLDAVSALLFSVNAFPMLIGLIVAWLFDCVKFFCENVFKKSMSVGKFFVPFHCLLPVLFRYLHQFGVLRFGPFQKESGMC